MSSLLLKLFSNDIPCAVLVAVAKMNRNLQQQLPRVVHVRANADGDNVVLVELVRAIHIDLCMSTPCRVEYEHEQGSHVDESGTASATRSTATSTADAPSRRVLDTVASAGPLILGGRPM